MSGRLSFNTDTLPERDRFSAYCEEMVRRYAALDILARDNRENFSARIELQCAGSVGVGFIATSPSDYVRQPQQLRDGDDALCVVLCLEGGAYQTQRGDEQALRAGEAIVCDSGRVGGIHVMVASQFWSLDRFRGRKSSVCSPRSIGTRAPSWTRTRWRAGCCSDISAPATVLT